MDFSNVKWKHRLKYLNRFGKKHFFIGAAIVSSATVGYHFGVFRQFKGRFNTKVYATAAVSRPTEFKFASWDTNWDRRNLLTSNLTNDGKKVQKTVESGGTPKAKRHLLLIRHGQYNEEADCDKERSLTEIGQFQAKVTGQRLLELNLPYTRLVASTMTRAKQTAQIMRGDMKANYLEVELDDILVEGAPVVPSPPTSNWKPQASQFFQDGARIESAFRKYFHRADAHQVQDSYELIVCHSNVIRYFVCRALQFPLSGWIRFSIANCSMTMITIHPDGLVMVEMLGDHGHIPAEGVTYH